MENTITMGMRNVSTPMLFTVLAGWKLSHSSQAQAMLQTD